MSQAIDIPLDSEVPLFDIFVEMTAGVQLSDVERLALEVAKLPRARVDTLIKALNNGPKVKIGASVTKDRVESAQDQFAKAGLRVIVTPVLALQAMVTGAFDGRFLCPACDERVVLPDNRQCPNCGVFVDKVDEAFLLKRKIMQQERAKLDMQAARETKEANTKTRQSLEAAIREQIREELEAEYGIQKGGNGLFQGKQGLLRAGGMLVLVGAAFLGGQSLPAGALPWGNKTKTDKVSTSNTAANVDQMLTSSLGPSGAAALPGGAPANTAGVTGDPDIDNDPMMQAIGGKRLGAKGLTIEQAIGAATVLAKSVGNTTAQRAMAGLPGPTGAAESTPANVPAATKLILKAEFAVELAELGQANRAQEILKGLVPAAAAEPLATMSVRLAELEVHAWGLQTLPESKARAAADTLRSQAQAINDPVERTLALSRIGVILSQQELLAPEVSHAFLSLAADSLKAIGDTRQQSAQVGPWMVSMGQVLVAQTEAYGKSGRWNKAQTSSASFEALLKQSPDEFTKAKLLALDFRLQSLMGQTDRANQSWAAALALSAKPREFVQQAASLRALAQLARIANQTQVQAALAALSNQLVPASGPDKAQALSQLAMLQADAGAQAPSERLSQLAESATGVTPAEMVAIKADLVVRTDLALARSLHRAGAYAQAEVLLVRVGDFLF